MSDNDDQTMRGQTGVEIYAARKFRRRYQSLAEIELQAVWAAEPDGAIIEEMPGWQRMTGLTWEETRGEGWLRAVHPHDRAAVRRRWSSTVHRRTRWNQVFRLRRADGTYRHVRGRAVPVFEEGRLVEWVGTCVDIEQEWQQEQNRRLLDKVAAATADIGDLREVLGLLSQVIVANVSDGCGIYLITEDADQQPGSFLAERVACVSRDGLPPAPLRTERFGEHSGLVEAVRSRRPVHRTFPSGAPPPEMMPPGTEGWFEHARCNSIALVPVLVDGTVAAVVAAGASGSHRPIDVAEIDLLGRILDHAHPHLSNAVRFQRTQRIAVALQHSLLPDLPDLPGVEICARYWPSVTDAEIGGDWYDSFRLPGGATILTIGDVAGHDLAAAVTMSQTRNILRGLAMDRREPPGHLLRRLDRVLEAFRDDTFTTCILARLENVGDRWRLRYSVAGHPPPLLISTGGRGRYLEAAVGPVLGLPVDERRTSAVAALPPYSTLLLYTDGLIEVPGEHLDEGLMRLRRHAAALAHAPLNEFCDQLLAQVLRPHKDDIAMIAVRMSGD
ncbi:SpoIIE family protein phosphatase [Nonomuraea aridisoli]|uniref:protein-serine/threonine phosphatase n=1 Tax=Nonomuraea aridisoli TaxID=2070368 RepID=A0A2W2G0I4_9ACTN|nr:SpoIIE family protein phosphatase [Nonomuraea aridisoli]PZG20434.1 serine/threonine protein phosphatase [Nonomuraea aridisoli]